MKQQEKKEEERVQLRWKGTQHHPIKNPTAPIVLVAPSPMVYVISPDRPSPIAHRIATSSLCN